MNRLNHLFQVKDNIPHNCADWMCVYIQVKRKYFCCVLDDHQVTDLITVWTGISFIGKWLYTYTEIRSLTTFYKGKRSGLQATINKRQVSVCPSMATFTQIGIPRQNDIIQMLKSVLKLLIIFFGFLRLHINLGSPSLQLRWVSLNN
jgi:hypothetical protein